MEASVILCVNEIIFNLFCFMPGTGAMFTFFYKA
jgi:hypothetical protein